MNEFLQPETEDQRKERHQLELRQELAQFHGITDERQVDLAVALFHFTVVEGLYLVGKIVDWQMVEEAHKELLAAGASPFLVWSTERIR